MEVQRTTAVAEASGFMHREHIPALAIAVSYHGRLLVDTAFGFADLDDSARATRRTLFRIGSISKAITAAAALHASGEHLLSLEADIHRYVPAFPPKPHPILIRQLLTGTGGIRGYVGDEYRRSEHFSSMAATLSLFAGDSLAYTPGTSYLETPYGFTLLGLALEAQSHTSYEAYVRRVILEPARMRETVVDDRASFVPGRAKPYTRDSLGQLRNADPIDVSYKVPAGGWLASAGDVARFGQAILHRILFNDAAYASMMAPVRLANRSTLPLGMGTAIGNAGGRLPGDNDAIWSSGLLQGGTAVLLIYPQSDLVVSVLTNVNGEVGADGFRFLMQLSQLAVTIARQYR